MRTKLVRRKKFGHKSTRIYTQCYLPGAGGLRGEYGLAFPLATGDHVDNSPLGGNQRGIERHGGRKRIMERESAWARSTNDAATDSGQQLGQRVRLAGRLLPGCFSSNV